MIFLSMRRINLTIQRSLSHNPLRVESDIIPDDTVSVDGGTSEAEHEEVNEQESLLSDHSQVDINVQREMLQPKRRQRKPAVESHSFGNEDIIDGARLSRPELPPEEFVFVDAQERTLQTSAVPACHVWQSGYLVMIDSTACVFRIRCGMNYLSLMLAMWTDI